MTISKRRNQMNGIIGGITNGAGDAMGGGMSIPSMILFGVLGLVIVGALFFFLKR